MTWKQLEANEALLMNSDLWLVAELQNSYWARKIDWYLGFQMNRAAVKKMPRAAEPLIDTAATWDFEIPQIKVADDAPLLISTSHLVPNRVTVQVPNPTTFSAWIKKCEEIWHDLGKPSVRIFLPEKVKTEDLAKYWPARGESFTFVAGV